MEMVMNKEVPTIMPKGKIDAERAPGLEDEIFKLIDEKTPVKIILDLKDVTYISSIGLRLVLKVKKRVSDIEIINASSAVYEVFYITGLSDAFHMLPPKDYIEKSDYMSELSENLKVTHKDDVSRRSWGEKPEIPLTGINDTTEEFTFISVIDMFREQVKKNPDKIAVVSPTLSLTYRRLDELSNKVANVLLLMGVVPEDVIMIMLPRDVDTYIATLGVLKAGAAYTIVNVKYPDERIEYIYNDAACKYMISNNPTVLNRLELIADVLKKRPLFMESMISSSFSYAPEIDIDPSWLCYLIYTSGSTGKPKGVMIEHGNLTNFVYPTSKNYEANGITQKGTVVLAMAQMTFDVSVMEEFLGLTSGMTVALAGEEEIINPLLMSEFMIKNGVDAICATPAYINTLISIPELNEAIRRIKTIDFGAEAFPGVLYTKIRKVNPDVYIMNGYGPTEATISCTMKVIESPDDITIGVPNANVYVFVVDKDLNELPKGEIGELLVCGMGVGRGYKNLPDKTAESFVTYKGLRGYRTGDLVSINDNDEIEFHGRKDNQVKLRGLRIELDEVEKAIASHKEVKQAAVKVFDNKLLVGYYTLDTKGSIKPDEIKTFIGQTLAHYMIPEVMVELESMPVTANQKIDRKALTRPETEAEEIVPPQNKTQEIIIGILEEILDGIPVGITTDLTEVGLSSLDTMLLATRLDEEFDVDVKFDDIYSNPTVCDIERMLSGKPARRKRRSRDRYPCFSTIASAYELLTADETSTQWNLPYLYSGDRDVIQVDKLKKAVANAFNAHPGLWSRFICEDDKVYALPNPTHPDYEIRTEELTDEEFNAKRVELVRPFRSDDTCFFRAELYLTPSKVYLLLDFAHLIMDGESYDILLADIDKAYRGETLKKESFTIYDVLEEQRLFLESGGVENAIGYYRELFADFDVPTTFGKDKQDEIVTTNRFEHKISMNADKVTGITRDLRITDTLLFVGLLSACFAHKSGNNRTSCLIIYNGRNGSGVQDTVGFLAQVYFALSEWDEDTTVGEFLRNLQKQIIKPMSFTCQPYLEMMTERPELTTYAFNYLGEISYHYPLGDVKLKSEAMGVEGSGGLYGVYQEIYIKDANYYCSTEYRLNEYNEEMIRKIPAALDVMLAHFDPDVKLSKLLESVEA